MKNTDIVALSTAELQSLLKEEKGALNKLSLNHSISPLENTIKIRRENADSEKSYVASLFKLGINKIAQKVGEEAIEVVIEAKDDNDDLFLSESADLLFHYLILLQAKGFKLNDVISVLKQREK